MKEYVITLIVTVAVCSLAVMLSPESGRGLGNYTRLAASLCILCVVISPIASFLDSLHDLKFDAVSNNDGVGDAEKLEEIYAYMLERASGEEISERIHTMICREMDMSYDDVEVFVFPR